ncbi:hypothetical protein BB464_07440 [Helicobacter pylori]|nr:hypothetical protein BB464_07440 [Helicobacter pylori]
MNLFNFIGVSQIHYIISTFIISLVFIFYFLRNKLLIIFYKKSIVFWRSFLKSSIPSKER